MSIYKELSCVVERLRPRRFLEVGVGSGANLAAIDCPYKTGIDPNPMVISSFPYRIYTDTSDNVFGGDEFRNNEEAYDLIFIDGLHKFRQVVRDVENSLKFLAPKGLIICHDVFPFDRLDKCPGLTNKEYPGPDKPWCGDVWKLIFYVRFCMPQLNFCTVNNFPGYLYLWRNAVPRKKEEKFDINLIDGFSVTNGMIHKNLMNVIPLEKVWECRNL
jgi:hypothetical protein